VVSPRGRREQVRFLRERSLSKRRACVLLEVPRSTMTYYLRQPGKDAAVLVAMNWLPSHYPRYGYRRIRIFLRREGLPMGINPVRRLWRQAGLGLPNGDAHGT
jgi:putative transposase